MMDIIKELQEAKKMASKARGYDPQVNALVIAIHNLIKIIEHQYKEEEEEKESENSLDTL